MSDPTSIKTCCAGASAKHEADPLDKQDRSDTGRSAEDYGFSAEPTGCCAPQTGNSEKRPASSPDPSGGPKEPIEPSSRLNPEPAVFAEGSAYAIEGMDCGACAVTLEKHLRRLTDVREVSVSFATGKMQIAHELSEGRLLSEVSKAGFTVVLPPSSSERDEPADREAASGKRRYPKVTAAAVSGILLALGFAASYLFAAEWIAMTLYGLSIAAGGRRPARSAFYAVRSRSLDMNVLMTAAAIGAVAIGEWLEGATVVFLFALGGELQSGAIEKTRRSIRGLMDLAPPEAWIRENGVLVRVPVQQVLPGREFVVKPGEKIPLDGEVIAGVSAVNQAPITGESIPVDKEKGSPVYAGTVNESGSLDIRATRAAQDTALARIIHMVEEAQEKKAPSQAFVDRFSRIYTPVVFVLALLFIIVPPLVGLGSWGEWFYRGLELLVVACPCALVISTPVAVVSAIGNAARHGVLIKGGAALEAAGSIQAVAFDKTGTLTSGRPQVVEVKAAEGSEEELLLRIARTIEEHSAHPVAAAITGYAEVRGFDVYEGDRFEAIAGRGAKATIEGESYFAGSPRWLRELEIPLGSLETTIVRMQEEGSTLIAVGSTKGLLGIIAVADTVRPESLSMLQALRKAGVRQTIMLTGDHAGTAHRIAAEAGIDRFKAELMPEHKVAAIRAAQAEGTKIAMVGDGINDAPALAAADLGIAMGGAGTDTAMETADIVLMADNLERLPHTIELSRRTLRIIKQNIAFSILIKVIALLLIIPGWLTLWMAVLSDTGAALIVVLSSMRLLSTRRKRT